MRSILRPKDVYGRGNPLPVGHSKFYCDYVLHDESDPYVPGTTIPRVRSVPLGERAVGFFSDEIAALLDALGKLRGTKIVLPAKSTVTSPGREKAVPRSAAA
jgi:hypothetical protein